MSRGQMEACAEEASTDDLVRTVRTTMRHRVHELAIHRADDGGVTVTGRGQSYHCKQLVTQALRRVLPDIALYNEIVVE